MTDRELLKLAAKAARLVVVDRGYPVSLYVESDGCKSGVRWNPLTDDSDALRLAVKLRFVVNICRLFTHVANGEVDAEEMNNNNDPYAATRRAIVRAAAEIGKYMK